MTKAKEEEKPVLNLAQKLIEIRKSVPYVKKETKGNKGAYASGSIILGALKSKMDELGVLLEPHILNKQSTHYEQKTQNGSRAMIEVQADMLMVWVDAESGEERKVPFACFGAQSDIAMAFGTALTYSERYFMLKYFNIPTDKLDPEAFQRKAEDTTSKLADPKKELADYSTPMMETNTIKEYNIWVKSNWANASEDLSNTDMKKLGGLCEEWLKELEKKENKQSKEKPEFITCPQSNQKSPIADCKLSDCAKSCKIYQDAVK